MISSLGLDVDALHVRCAYEKMIFMSERVCLDNYEKKTFSWSIPRYGDTFRDFVIRFDTELGLNTDINYYDFIDKIEIVIGNGMFTQKITGKDIYILHQSMSLSNRNSLITAAKYGVIYVPMGLILCLFSIPFSHIRVNMSINNRQYVNPNLDKLYGILSKHITHSDLFPIIMKYAKYSSECNMKISGYINYVFYLSSFRNEMIRPYMYNFHQYFHFEKIVTHPRNGKEFVCEFEYPHSAHVEYIFQILLLVEDPDNSFQFYTMKDNPIKKIELDTDCKQLNKYEISNLFYSASDVSLYSISFHDSCTDYVNVEHPLVTFPYHDHKEVDEPKDDHKEVDERFFKPVYVSKKYTLKFTVTFHPHIQQNVRIYGLAKVKQTFYNQNGYAYEKYRFTN